MVFIENRFRVSLGLKPFLNFEEFLDSDPEEFNELSEKIVLEEAARILIDQADGVGIMDEPDSGIFPTPLDTTNKDDCLVGRVRKDIVLDKALSFWVVGDQVRKGAALNAVQIAELLS